MCIECSQRKTINGAILRRVDLTGSNGVVHVIDRVLYPLTTAGNLVQTLASDPEGRSVHHTIDHPSKHL